MSIATLECEILKGVREQLKNPKIRQKDIMAWSTSEEAVVLDLRADTEDLVVLKDLDVWVAVLKKKPKAKATAKTKAKSVKKKPGLKKVQAEKTAYSFIHAYVFNGENLVWKWRLKDADVDGSLAHDEDVSAWSDDDIRESTIANLDLNKAEAKIIEIIRD